MLRNDELSRDFRFTGLPSGWPALGCTVAAVLSLTGEVSTARAIPAQPPNVVFVIADDCSWSSFGAYGDATAATPAFDRLCAQGVRFTHAFVSEPTCGPSRASILTGQDFWRLEDASVFGGTLQSTLPVYPHLLADAGYFVGSNDKVWGPGSLQDGGWSVNPGGERFRDFQAFLDAAPADQPFCFWQGSRYGHRPFPMRVGPDGSATALDEARVPPFLPDRPEVRRDLIGHAYEVESFDRQLARLLELLDARGLAQDTLVVVTSDHGMPIPRGKANLYDQGTRVPLVIRWPARVADARVVDALVSLTDLAPTFLDAAGVPIPACMSGRSLMDLLVPAAAGSGAKREQVVFGREIGLGSLQSRQRMKGSACRGLRTERFLYVQNHGDGPLDPAAERFGPAGPILASERADDPALARLYALSFGPRPREELYDCLADPHQMINLAADPAYADTRQELCARLQDHLVAHGDSRALGRPEVFAGFRVQVGSRLLQRTADGAVVTVEAGAARD